MKALVVTSLFFSSTWLSLTLLLTCLQPNWLIAAAVSTVLGYLRHCHAKDHLKRLKKFPAIKMFFFFRQYMVHQTQYFSRTSVSSLP